MTNDLDERERTDRVNAACRWYRGNLAYIKALLAQGDLKVPHADGQGFSLYPSNWHLEFWIDKWEMKDKRFSLGEAEAMISDQLRPLFPVVRDRMGANRG